MQHDAEDTPRIPKGSYQCTKCNKIVNNDARVCHEFLHNDAAMDRLKKQEESQMCQVVATSMFHLPQAEYEQRLKEWRNAPMTLDFHSGETRTGMMGGGPDCIPAPIIKFRDKTSPGYCIEPIDSAKPNKSYPEKRRERLEREKEDKKERAAKHAARQKALRLPRPTYLETDFLSMCERERMEESGWYLT